MTVRLVLKAGAKLRNLYRFRRNSIHTAMRENRPLVPNLRIVIGTLMDILSIQKSIWKNGPKVLFPNLHFIYVNPRGLQPTIFRDYYIILNTFSIRGCFSFLIA